MNDMSSRNAAMKAVMEMSTPLEHPPKIPKWMPFAFVIVGAAISMPTVSFTAPRQYFLYKLRTQTSNEAIVTTTIEPSNMTTQSPNSHASLNELQQLYESSVVIVINSAIFVFNILSVLIASKIRFVYRLLLSLVVCFLLLIPAIVMALTPIDPTLFFYITMSTVFFLVGFSTLAFSSFISFSATISQSMLHVTMLTVAIGAIVVSLLNVMSILVQQNESLTAIYYFGSSAFLLFFATIVAFFVLRTESLQWYAARLHSGKKAQNTGKSNLGHIWESFKNSWIFHINHFLAFFCNGTIFPAIATAIASVDYNKDDLWYGKLFMPVAIFLNYYVMMLIGRIFPSVIRLPPLRYYKWILLITLCRFSFVPLFAFCNVQPRNPDVPVVFNHDAYPIIFMSLHSIIHGYFQVLVVQYASQHVKPHQREHVTMIGIAFTAIGQISGAFLSIPILKVIAPATSK